MKKTALSRLINLPKWCAVQGSNPQIPLCNNSHLRVKAHKEAHKFRPIQF